MKEFNIKKVSGTYADALEAYGLANIIQKLLVSINCDDSKITIRDIGASFVVSTEIDITKELLNEVNYFPLFRYISMPGDKSVDLCEIDYINCSEQSEHKKIRDEKIKSIRDSSISNPEKVRKIEELYSSYNVDVNLATYELIGYRNNLPTFNKLYRNFNSIKSNLDEFKSLLVHILNYYSSNALFEVEGEFKVIENKTTSLQIYNPDKGKGINQSKPVCKYENLKSEWIPETMKISGAMSEMICRYVGDKQDLKIFVPHYSYVTFNFKQKLMENFWKRLRGNTSIKIDVMTILQLSKLILENSYNSGRRINGVVIGLYSVYQKDMGQQKAVSNIGHLNLPNFIYDEDKESNRIWIQLLDEQINLIRSLDENNEGFNLLKTYRDFLSGSDVRMLLKFSQDYSVYLVSQKSKNKRVIYNNVKTLNILFNSMDNQNLKLMEIINDEGFQAVAKAIRNSTIILQSLPKNIRKYDVRYGIAQSLQTKSKSADDIAIFIGEFIASYNSEIARIIDKGDNPMRRLVRENELNSFYSLLDNKPSHLVGALLSSYGFANEVKEDKDNNNEDENI